MDQGLKKPAGASLKAVVLWWNFDTIAVICPKCSKVESHSAHSRAGKINWHTDLILTVLCCLPGLTYEAVFPWMIGLDWEKNFALRALHTVGLDLTGLNIGGSFDPMTFSVAGPPLGTLGAREALKKGTIIRGVSGKDWSSQIGKDNKEKGREKEFSLRSAIQTPPFSPRMVLGDMKLTKCLRLGSNAVQIFAPHATIDGDVIDDPLAILKSDTGLAKKTFGILNRKGAFIPVITRSGWKHSSSKLGNNVLRQDIWSGQVRVLCEFVSHPIEPHNLDHGVVGSYYCSHAEKQLIAFTIRMHYFLKGGFEDFDMERLKELQPYLGLREVWIATSSSPCRDCEEFKKRVENVCGVRIHFVLMKKSGWNEEEEEPTTPHRLRAARSQVATPPSSGNRLSDEHLADDDDDDDDEAYEEDSDRYENNGDPSSPCYRRNLRSDWRRSRPTSTREDSYRPVAKKTPTARRRPHCASANDSTDSDEPLAPRRKIPKVTHVPPIIDLTSDTTDNDENERENENEKESEKENEDENENDDSEGSCYSP